MRYLVFNLLVVGALAFLLFDGEPPATVRGAVDKVAVKADRLIEKGKALVEKTVAEPAPPVVRAPAAPELAAPAPVAEPRDTPVVAVKPAKPVPPKPAATASARALDPAVARRRAEILGEAPDSAPDSANAAPAATTDFMTPRVRRGELQKLAEDMELMFVEKAGR